MRIVSDHATRDQASLLTGLSLNGILFDSLRQRHIVNRVFELGLRGAEFDVESDGERHECP
jgi:hypothetical protein